MNDRRFRVHPLSAGQTIALGFGIVIALGTALLALPFSSRSGNSCGLLPALFTATSATCVTGLALADSWLQWSAFGQGVLLALIEVGGLGFLSVTTLLVFALRQRLDLRSLLLLSQTLGASDLRKVGHIQRQVLQGSFAAQAVGAAILTARIWARFRGQFSLGQTIWLSVFHAGSAFCNAGFDLMGIAEPGSSLALFADDPIVLLTVAALIIWGGLGFVVWDELLHRRPRRWSVYTKLAVGCTAALLAGGTALFFLLERQNPDTLGAMPLWQQLLGAFFQSATTRTAGFAAFDQGALTDTSKAMTMLLMFIGGCSGSTAGGLKAVTFLVLLLFLKARATGRSAVTVLSRTVPDSQCMDALSLFCLMVTVCFAGSTALCATSGVPLIDSLFETVSALATVGLSTGITGQLRGVSQLILIAAMYLGRVGILTLLVGFLQDKKPPPRYSFPTASLLIG